jgi:hypothetical protein
MRATKLTAIFAVLLHLALPRCQAFSLIGPFSGWQTPDIGYDTVFDGQELAVRVSVATNIATAHPL